MIFLIQINQFNWPDIPDQSFFSDNSVNNPVPNRGFQTMTPSKFSGTQFLSPDVAIGWVSIRVILVIGDEGGMVCITGFVAVNNAHVIGFAMVTNELGVILCGLRLLLKSQQGSQQGQGDECNTFQMGHVNLRVFDQKIAVSECTAGLMLHHSGNGIKPVS
jgi:hypothetical protein